MGCHSDSLRYVLARDIVWTELAAVPRIGAFSLCTTNAASDNVGLGYANLSFAPYFMLTLFNGSMGIIGGVADVQVGGASSPSFGFLGNPNSGMFSPNGGVAFSVNGTERMRIDTNGSVGIGTLNPGQCGGSNTQPCLLTVNGAIGAKEIVVTSGITADYVFSPDYRLRPLSEVAAYVKENHHLPEIPSAADVKQYGFSVGEMQVKLLAKLEELTLHLIQADEKIRELQEKVAAQAVPGR